MFWLPSKKNCSAVMHAPPTAPWPVGSQRRTEQAGVQHLVWSRDPRRHSLPQFNSELDSAGRAGCSQRPAGPGQVLQRTVHDQDHETRRDDCHYHQLVQLTGRFCTSGSEREFTLEKRWYVDETMNRSSRCCGKLKWRSQTGRPPRKPTLAT